MQALKVDVPATILQSLSKITDPGELKKKRNSVPSKKKSTPWTLEDAYP